ncbi:slit homolog 3 protein-like [Strongylocentrotus purpuratus]|uniref:LRRCT domain-containing protein n=1 Tax=Strongylocentrotus purpuratus TaxID=7668 RepID=A0A7M7SZW5_STRPU|nr:slit homolog 3 protein-like [Strongylocentrotus purpuratus]
MANPAFCAEEKRVQCNRKYMCVFVFMLLFSFVEPEEEQCPTSCKCASAYVYCRNQLLTEVPTANISLGTRGIDLSKNNIRMIETESFPNLTSLQRLILNRNAISIIEPRAFQHMSALTILYLSNNLMTDVSFMSLLPKIFLIAISNLIQSLAIKDSPFVVFDSLDISFNFIRSFADSCVVITDLSADSCGIRVFDIPESQTAYAVRTITMRNNFIRSLPDLSGLPRLQLLDLQNNLIQRAAHVIPHKLKSLSLDNNSPSSLPKIRLGQSLTVLKIGRNRIESLVGFGDTNALEILDLSNNSLQDVSHIPIMDGLKYVTLSHCNLHGKSMFHSLYMDNVTLFHRRDASNEPLNLTLALDRELFLRYNSFITIPSIKAMHVAELDLSFNNINLLERDSFKLTPRISYLNLKGNAITSIQMHALRFNMHLVLVNLEDNHLQVIGHEALVKMGHFDLLLGNNDLVNISPLTLPEVSRSISFDPNPWRCDCSLHPLYRWYMRSNENTLTCWTPIHLRGRTLATLTDEELCPLIRNVSNENDISDSVCCAYDHHEKQLHQVSSRSKWSPRLQLLDLQNNLIQRAAHVIPHKLKSLSLDNNSPSSLPKIRLGQSLTVLKIGRNRIESLVGFGDTDALEILDLSNNSLQDELFLRYNSFIPIPSIKAMHVAELDLSFNNINLLERDSFKLTPRISYLNLKGNAITSIQMHALRFNVHLVLVNLEDNHLQVIGHEALVKMGHFDLLLGNNDLVNISPLTLPEVSRSISFDPNPWRCDCSLRPLYRWYMRSNENTLTCWTPIHLRGRTLATLTDEELCPLIRNVSNENDISGEEAPDILSNGAKKLELKKGIQILAGVLFISRFPRPRFVQG